METKVICSRAGDAGPRRCWRQVALGAVAAAGMTLGAHSLSPLAAAAPQTAAPLLPADACGTPPPLPATEKPQQAVFSGGYPVALPAVSPTGVRNDLPSPYAAGIAWGEPGRPWGSTASVTSAPDGTLWIGTELGGLHRFNGKVFTRVSLEAGFFCWARQF